MDWNTFIGGIVLIVVGSFGASTNKHQTRRANQRKVAYSSVQTQELVGYVVTAGLVILGIVFVITATT